MLLWAVLAVVAHPSSGCTDTPGWSNDCVKEGCKPSQFSYGSTPGYFNTKGKDSFFLLHYIAYPLRTRAHAHAPALARTRLPAFSCTVLYKSLYRHSRRQDPIQVGPA